MKSSRVVSLMIGLVVASLCCVATIAGAAQRNDKSYTSAWGAEPAWSIAISSPPNEQIDDDPTHVLELVDRVLELAVEHDPVGDHDHLVEHLLVGRVVQGGEPVREPGDRVRLARPGLVLD